jgi:hypothetical protein
MTKIQEDLDETKIILVRNVFCCLPSSHILIRGLIITFFPILQQ